MKGSRSEIIVNYLAIRLMTFQMLYGLINERFLSPLTKIE